MMRTGTYERIAETLLRGQPKPKRQSLAIVVEEQIMRRLIRGKFDSQFKQVYNVRTMKFTGQVERGTFDTAMNYARKNRDGTVVVRDFQSIPKGRVLCVIVRENKSEAEQVAQHICDLLNKEELNSK